MKGTGRQKCDDPWITCTSIGSAGNLWIVTFLGTYYFMYSWLIMSGMFKELIMSLIHGSLLHQTLVAKMFQLLD